MESHEQLRAELRAADRGETVGWTDYRFPAWTPIAMAIWTATFTAGLLYLDGPWDTVSALAHLALALGYIRWDRRTQAAYPSSQSRMPAEYWPSLLALCAVPVVIILAVVVVNYYVASWAAVVVASVTWGGAVWLYNRSYARASARVQERLA